MKDFKGKVAVVTGAASGIGRGLAARCAFEGMKVVLVDIEQAPLVEAEADLRAAGAEVLAVRVDVSKAADVEALARNALDRFGAVHLLFNNQEWAPAVRSGTATWLTGNGCWEPTCGGSSTDCAPLYPSCWRRTLTPTSSTPLRSRVCCRITHQRLTR